MRELSSAEKKVIADLGHCMNSMAALPEVHPSDRPEFANAIHVCQNIVFARPAFEALKAELFEPVDPFVERIR